MSKEKHIDIGNPPGDSIHLGSGIAVRRLPRDDILITKDEKLIRLENRQIEKLLSWLSASGVCLQRQDGRPLNDLSNGKVMATALYDALFQEGHLEAVITCSDGNEKVLAVCSLNVNDNVVSLTLQDVFERVDGVGFVVRSVKNRENLFESPEEELRIAAGDRPVLTARFF